jgi:hypothetical protein
MVGKIQSISAVLNDSPFYGDLAVDPALTTGFTFAYTAGTSVDGNVATTIASGTEVLSANDTFIIFREGATMGNAVQGSEPDESMRLYTVTTDGSAISSIVDTRGHVS